jgi:hypothetical protein
MRILKRISFATVGTLIVIALAGFIFSPSAVQGDKPAPVEVTNIPLPVSGTVAATQDGTWNVGIDSANNTVLIGNPATNPLLVRDIDNPALQPFSADTDYFLPPFVAPNTVQVNPNVEAGKRLVIEYVSAKSALSLTDTLTDITIQTSTGFHYFPMPPPNAANGVAVFSQRIRMYHDSGTPITVLVNRATGNGNGDFHISISGYVVNLPTVQ